ncbi:nicotinate-nucleotide adenylyltransferase [Clostridium niameyense]|uniref:nicotinate-nucleotide adenylyltransferase n=1 Tax=Clostridium niameyense TaxID=1622073 RepID=UPI00067E7778|nr:nicotinate-nucleotide adenylyltransferase [Clostridium niameyense]
MVKKAILGGTFDPIHNGHINVAYEALERFKLDKVIFMPAGNPPHKLKIEKTPANIRYEMVKIAIQDEEKFSISDYEINRKDISYTYKTLKYFTKLEPDTSWYFITGADCLSYLDHWKNLEEILSMCNFVIFSREGFKQQQEIINAKRYMEQKYKDKMLFIEAPILDISSTNIRNRIESGKEVKFYMPDSVYEFIKYKNIYKK